jgi:hypothetical protein
MTLSTLNNRVSYAGNGVTTAFSFPNKFLADEDLVVILVSSAGVETVKTLTTHYTVTGEGNDAGGTVTMLTAPAAGETLVIYRDPSQVQEADFEDQDAFPADTLEEGLDLLTMLIQRLDDRIDRAVTLSEGYSDTFDMSLPAELTASMVLGINADGDGFELYDLADEGQIGVPASNGMAAYTGSNTFVGRTITAGAGIAVTNGDGQSGNPTVAVVPTTLVTGQTEDSAPALDDYLLSYDASATAAKKISLANALNLAAEQSLRNFVINGNFDFWQRGTSFAAASDGAYSADRFDYKKATTGAAHTLSQSSDVPTLTESGFQSKYSLLVDCTTADAAVAAGDLVAIRTGLEGYAWAKLQNKACILSFWVKATKTGTYCVAFSNNGSDRSYVAEYTVSAADTWEKKTVALTMNPSGGTNAYEATLGLSIRFTLMAGTTYQTTSGSWQTGNFYATSSQVNACDDTANNFRLSQVILNVGTKAAPFDRSGLSAQGELSLCQRYYEKSYDQANAPGAVNSNGSVWYLRSGSNSVCHVPFKATKRTAPTVTVYSPITGTSAKVRDNSAGADQNSVVIQIGESGFSQNGGLGTDGNIGHFHYTADAEL